jgi:dihydropteroate synthase
MSRTGTLVCGILNVTPDSFSDGGQYYGEEGSIAAALRHAEEMVLQGADMIDIGGESTRPGSVAVTPAEEGRRVVPVIRAIRGSSIAGNCVISVDTRSGGVARAAVEAGADVVNDVSGGRFDPTMLATVGELHVPYVVMHSRGTPQTMTRPEYTVYGDLVSEVGAELNEQLALVDGVLPRWLQWVDPGVGFAKGEEDNLKLLRPASIRRLRGLVGGRVVLVGASRKRFLGSIVDRRDRWVEGQVQGQGQGEGRGLGEEKNEGRERGMQDKTIAPMSAAAPAPATASTPASTSATAPAPAPVSMTDRRVAELDWATSATTALAVMGGARVVRVHCVGGARRVCDVLDAVNRQ